MLVPIVLRKSFTFNLEENGLDIDCFEGGCTDTDFTQLLLMIKNTYTINVEMVGSDDDDDLFYDYDSFRRTIDRKQPFFFDLAKIENKIVRSAVYAVFKEWVNKVAVVNGKTFHEWEMIFG
jgi:hypothetical protein